MRRKNPLKTASHQETALFSNVLCLGIYRNMTLCFVTQASQNPPLRSSSVTNEVVFTLLGLDPALPAFELADSSSRLDKGKANQ
jgi:hypothetical protein